MIANELQVKIAERLEDAFGNDLNVVQVYSDDITEVIDFAADPPNKRRANEPHVFIFSGPNDTIENNTVRDAPRKQFQFEIFIVTRSNRRKERIDQEKEANLWGLLVEAALRGRQFGSDTAELTNEAPIKGFTQVPVASNEELTVHSLAFFIDLDVCLDYLLENYRQFV